MKKFSTIILCLLLSCLLCLPTAAEGFNPKLTVDRTLEAAGSFTVTVENTAGNNTILAQKQPTLRLPCTYPNAIVIMPNGERQTGTVNGGQIGFKVTMGGTYTIMHAEPAKTLTGIAVTTQPKLSYTEGEKLDLTNMVVTAYYSDNSTAELAYTDVMAAIPHGTVLELTHDGTAIVVIYGGKIAETEPLVVKKAVTPKPENKTESDFWLMVLVKLYSQKYTIGAIATEGGEITPEGITNIKYGRNLTYTFMPDEGHTIADVLVDGKSVGAVSEYTFKKVRKAHNLVVIFTPIAEDPAVDAAE